MKRKIIASALAVMMLTGCAMPEISFENADSPLFVNNGGEDSGKDQSAAVQTVKDESGKTGSEDGSEAVPSGTVSSVSDVSDAGDSSEGTVSNTTESTGSGISDAESGKTDDSSDDISKDDSKVDSKSEQKEKEDKPVISSEDLQQIALKTYSFADYSHGSNPASVRYQWLRLDDNAKELCPKLDKALEKKESSIKKEMISAFDELDTEAQKAGTRSTVKYAIERRAVPVRADNLVLSILDITRDSRGKKSEVSPETLNLDSQTGKEIRLDDIIETENLSDVLTESYQDIYPDDPVTDFEKTVSGYEDDDYIWAVSREGLNFYFTSDSGDELVTVPLLRSGNRKLFTDLYEDVTESFAVPVGEKDIVVFDKSDDGETDTLSVFLNDTKKAVTVSLNDKIGVGRFAANAITPVLVRTAEEGYYIYVCYETDSDREHLAVFDISGDSPVFLGLAENVGFPGVYDESEEASAVLIPAAPEEFTLYSDIVLLGTYSAVRPYRVGSDGMPEALDEWYYPDVNRELEVRTAFTADIIDPESDKIIEEDADISKGTKLLIYRTDGESIVDLKTEDDEIIRIDVDKSSGAPYQTIDGTNIEKLFDGILYAG